MQRTVTFSMEVGIPANADSNFFQQLYSKIAETLTDKNNGTWLANIQRGDGSRFVYPAPGWTNTSGGQTTR